MNKGEQVIRWVETQVGHTIRTEGGCVECYVWATEGDELRFLNGLSDRLEAIGVNLEGFTYVLAHVDSNGEAWLVYDRNDRKLRYPRMRRGCLCICHLIEALELLGL